MRFFKKKHLFLNSYTGLEPNGAKISNVSRQSRRPACESGLQMEGEAACPAVALGRQMPSRKNRLEYAYLIAIRARAVLQFYAIKAQIHYIFYHFKNKSNQI